MYNLTSVFVVFMLLNSFPTVYLVGLEATLIPRNFSQVLNNICLRFSCLHFSRLRYFSNAIKYSSVSDNVISNINNASSYLMVRKWFAGDVGGCVRDQKVECYRG